MEMKRIAARLAAFVIAMLVFALPALAQDEPTLSLRMSRDFGYSSGTGRIQGTFSMIASGPENLEQVQFKIDEHVIGEVNQPPFRLRFSTGDYPMGVHALVATGVTSDGNILESDPVRVEFISADEGWQTAGKIAIPIVAIVGSIMLATFLLPLLFRRGKRIQLPAGARRSYGMLGGGICPKCNRPFALHVFGLNLVVGKLDRCPYCGQWSLMRRASLQELHAAEAAELEAMPSEPDLTDRSEEDYRRQLEDSRYL
jgi:hypothetical protein